MHLVTQLCLQTVNCRTVKVNAKEKPFTSKSKLIHKANLVQILFEHQYIIHASFLCVLQIIYLYSGVLISPQPDQEGNKLQRQKILIFIYPIYNHNWRNISTIYIYITRLASNEIYSPSNKIHREVGRAKDLSAPL